MFDRTAAHKLLSGIPNSQSEGRQFGNSQLGERVTHGYAKFHTAIDDFMNRSWLRGQTVDDLHYDLPITATISARDPAALALLAACFEERGPLYVARNKAFTWSLSQFSITDVAQLIIRAPGQADNDEEPTQILEMSVPGTICAHHILDAVWAAYILSIKAGIDDRTIETRSLLGEDLLLSQVAQELIDGLAARATPYNRIYVSDRLYLDSLKITFDAASGTLIVVPFIGS